MVAVVEAVMLLKSQTQGCNYMVKCAKFQKWGLRSQVRVTLGGEKVPLNSHGRFLFNVQ